jgi:hypothetical protein
LPGAADGCICLRFFFCFFFRIKESSDKSVAEIVATGGSSAGMPGKPAATGAGTGADRLDWSSLSSAVTARFAEARLGPVDAFATCPPVWRSRVQLPANLFDP